MLLLPLSLAAEPAFWSSDAVSSQSRLFGKAQSRDAVAYDAATLALEAARAAVGDLDLGIALVGSPAGLAAYGEATRRQLAGQFLRLQKHADLVGADYSRVFGDAVQRALPTVGGGYDVKECAASSGIAALMGRAPKCPGKDLSPALAAAIDADPRLRAAVDEILGVDWPTIALPPAPQAVIPLAGGARSTDAAALGRALRGPELQEAQDAFEAAVEEDASQAAAARATWSKRVGEIGKEVFAQAKRKAPADVGLCANPAALGGCGVPDVTADVVARFGSR